MTNLTLISGKNAPLKTGLVLAIFYILAGLLHLLHPAWLLLITPSWVPFPRHVILVTGILEIIGALALLSHKFRAVAGVALALYAICVYPANIKHAMDSLSLTHGFLGWWYHVPRLALQPVLIWWPLFAAGLLKWPFTRIKKPPALQKNRGIPFV